MKHVLPVFIRVLAAEFYRINTGFFFIAAAVCFGFLSGREHLALANAFLSSFYLLLIPLAVWVLYSFKIMGFNSAQLTKTENQFLIEAAALPHTLRWPCIAISIIIQLTPILLYGSFLALIGIKLSVFIPVFTVMAMLLVLIVLLSWKMNHRLIHSATSKNISRLKNKLDRWITKPYCWFYIEWILRKQLVMLIGSKMATCLLIMGVARLYLFDSYDERLLAMGGVLAFVCNLALVFYYHRFENFHFRFLRSFPFSLIRRLSSFLLTFAILSLTEWIILLREYPQDLSIAHFFSIIAFALSVYIIAYAFLFIKDLPLEVFLQKAGIAGFVWIILILFQVPLLLLTVVHFIAGYALYQRYFYRFEFNSEITSDK